MKTVLITGANKSIGLETARQLLRQGCRVFLGSRDLARGQAAVAQLHAEGLPAATAVELDVDSEASVQTARATIGQQTPVLDVLINNAGINGGRPQTATGATLAAFEAVYNTNVFGVVRVTQAFLDLLRQSPQPRIVNVTSMMASLTLHNDPSWEYYTNKGAVYHSSKAALNMYTIVLAYELRDTPFKVNAVDPGFTATDFNQHRGTGTVEDAAARLVKYALLDENGPTGKFVSEDYNPATGNIPW